MLTAGFMRNKDQSINFRASTVAVVDYGMGNLFSIKNACSFVGLNSIFTNKEQEILNADAVILPGVGAFGKAMGRLNNLGLVEVLKKAADSGKPFLGICLGLQLLMSTSEEFGKHAGLNIFEGDTLRFSNGSARNRLKVPHVGWSQIHENKDRSWERSLLNGLHNGDYLYFVHSYYVVPKQKEIVLSTSMYGDYVFTSSVQRDNIFACQFHPERSCEEGLLIYKNFARAISQGAYGDGVENNISKMV
jgi:glutamine amidotransferase